jgi:hypothetical protein
MPEMWFERRHPDARFCDHDEACSVKSKSHARRLFRTALPLGKNVLDELCTLTVLKPDANEYRSMWL